MSELLRSKAVILDLDDTVVYTIQPIWALHKHVACEHYGITLTDEALRLSWGQPLSKLVQILYQTDDVELAFERIRAVKHLPEHKKTFVDPTHTAIDRIKETQKIGLLTAHHGDLIDLELEYLGIDRSYFDYFQTSDQTEHHKPEPEVFEPAIEWLAGQGIKPDEAVYVGDGLHDHEAATGAGLQFIGVETGLVSAGQFRAVGAVSVSTILEIPALLNF